MPAGNGSGLVTQNGAGVAIPAINKVVISTSISVLIENVGIGLVQQVTATNTQNATRIRHLDHLDAGRTVEQARAPEDHQLRMTGFLCYGDASLPGGQSPTGTVLDRVLGAAGDQTTGSLSNRIFRSLSSQILPFSVYRTHKRPGGAKTDLIIYHDNVMVGSTDPIQIGQVTVSEEIQMQPTFIT